MQQSKIWVAIFTHEVLMYTVIQIHIYKEDGKVAKIAFIYKISY